MKNTMLILLGMLLLELIRTTGVFIGVTALKDCSKKVLEANSSDPMAQFNPQFQSTVMKCMRQEHKLELIIADTLTSSPGTSLLEKVMN